MRNETTLATPLPKYVLVYIGVLGWWLGSVRMWLQRWRERAKNNHGYKLFGICGGGVDCV